MACLLTAISCYITALNTVYLQGLHTALHELRSSELNYTQEGAAAVSYVTAHVACCLGTALFKEAVSQLCDGVYVDSLSLTVSYAYCMRQRVLKPSLCSS